MSEYPAPPPGSKIHVETSGDTLRVVVPGRWTMIFWVALSANLLFIVATLVVPLFFPKEQEDPFFRRFVQMMPLWGVLTLLWSAFLFRPRRETLLLDRGQVETRGSFRPFVSRIRKLSDLAGFVLKPAEPDQLWQGTVMFYGLNRRKLLFAAMLPNASPRLPDLGLAVQADDAELAWLREVLEAHRRRLGGQRESSTSAPL